MPFPTPQAHDSISSTEEKILEYWKENNIFQKSIDSRKPEHEFRFFDGPPFATGTPHYGHILAGTLKDAIPRYKTMCGYRVNRKWGWDCHGVPVEFQVEKEHKIGGKPGIEAMGIDNFNELCRSVVLRCSDQWENTVDRMGRFVDFKNDYKTMDIDFMESVWWVFAQLYKKGLIYEGEKVVAYSPKLGSPLSNFEAGLEYKDIDDPAITVKFEVLNPKYSSEDQKTYFLAWTTTPWTLPANLALAVHPEIQYVKTKPRNGKSYILAESLLEKIFKDEIEIEKRIDGQSLIGLSYRPLFDFYKDHKNAFTIISAEYVSDEDGTGIVHIAPNFGEDDSRVSFENNILPLKNPIDENGYFDESISVLEGKYFRYDREVGEETKDNANEWVLNDLKSRDILFHRSQIRHSYPHCWRTDCALMYRGIKTWFVDIQTIKDTLIDENENINWNPAYLKHGRFGKGLETAPDWAISRNRYWGTPMPVWRCDKTGEVEIIGSREELERKSGQKVTDLHRHFIDDLTWKNETTGGTMRRIPEVLDCWFESGSMPYASTHYPFENGPKKCFKNDISIIRHGESHNNVSKTVISLNDDAPEYGLTDLGKQQAQEAAQKAPTFDVIVCSPLQRTQETAIPFAQKSGVEIIIDDRLREVDFGDLGGQSYTDCNIFSESNDIVTTRYPNGENVEEVQARTQELLEELEEKYKNKRILLVSHGLTVQTTLKWVKGEPLTKWEDQIKNASLYNLDHVARSDFQSADFIAEGLDQTRCWFYNLHVLGVALFGKNIYKNVITNGIVLAEDGSKMSKSKKNYPDPALIFNQYGADAMRFYLLNSPVARGENLRFSEKGVAEVLKSVILPLRSAYQFFATYANIDGWEPTKGIFIRHGEGEHNIKNILTASTDAPYQLTPKGIQQVQETAQKISHFDVLYASPTKRTQQTAEILKKEKKFDGNIDADDRLQEVGMGNLEGLPVRPVLERIANTTTEHPHSVQKRMMEVFEEGSQKNPGKTTVYISHSGAIRDFEAGMNNLSDLIDITRIAGPQTGGYKIFFPHPKTTTDLDRWIISELQTLLKEFRKSFDAYNIDGGLRLIPEFIDKLNNWYLRRSRRRFWASGMTDEKRSGYETLHYTLYTLSKILAPICPFLAEKMYQDLGGGESVHLEVFPFPQTKWINESIEHKVNLSREVVSLAAGIRARQKIKLRQPLKKLQFLTTQDVQLDLDIIREEANVKEVEILKSVKGIAQKIVRVNAKLVGPRLGKKVQMLIKAGKSGNFEMLDDGRVKIEDEVLESYEFEIGFVCEEGVEADATPNVVVILNTDISHDLEVEGFAREIIRAVQDLRKTRGFEVSDHITLRYQTPSKLLKEAFEIFGKEMAKETLADTIIDGGDIPVELHSDVADIAGEKAILSVEKV